MQIADDETHRSLTYLVAATRRGMKLTTDAFNAYVAAPDRGRPQYRRTLMDQAIASWEDAVGRQQVMPGELPSRHLVRLSWASNPEPEYIAPTPLGLAVLQELNRPTVDVSDDDPISVIIDPTDRLAYARIFDLIVSQSDGMIVDPYLRTPEFFELSQLPTVTRVLLSDHEIASMRPVVSNALASIERTIAVRFLPRNDLHDRYFIPDDGDVVVFGSSLNSITKRPGVVTTIKDGVASGAIREAYGSMWSRAEEIAPAEKVTGK